MNSPVCFHLSDGRVVDLFVGLRVVNPDGTDSVGPCSSTVRAVNS